MKKYLKIIILITLFLFFILHESTVLATEDIISNGREFLGAGKDGSDILNFGKFEDASNNIYNTFFIIGFVLTAIIGSVLGIQFMLSGVEGKAKIKEALIPYVIGCIVIFGAFGIWKISINIFKGIDDALPATKDVTYEVDLDNTDVTDKKNLGTCSCGEDLIQQQTINSNKPFCPTAGPTGNGTTKDGVKHSW